MRAASSLSGSGIGLTSTGVAQQGISLRYDVETRVDLAGKVGLGLDAYAGDKFTFSADAYDPDDVKLRLRAAYDLGGGTALLGQFDDVTDSEKRAGYFGLRQTF